MLNPTKSGMTLRYLGYACTNVSMPATTGRTLRLANLTGARVREVIEENLRSLLAILRWNAERRIYFFRVSSDVIPFASHSQFPLDWRAEFGDLLEKIRSFAAEKGMRLTMHPGQYTVLNSPRRDVTENAIAELEYHAAFLEAVDPLTGTFTLHVGGAYGDKEGAITRFRDAYSRLSPRARSRLTLENDDTTYSAGEVLALCESLGVAMVYDHHHHKCLPTSDEPDDVALVERVVATWTGAVPKFHLSSLKSDTRTGHADLVTRADLDDFLQLMRQVEGGDFDLMLEAKLKDKAVLHCFESYSIRPHEPVVREAAAHS